MTRVFREKGKLLVGDASIEWKECVGRRNVGGSFHPGNEQVDYHRFFFGAGGLTIADVRGSHKAYKESGSIPLTRSFASYLDTSYF